MNRESFPVGPEMGQRPDLSAGSKLGSYRDQTTHHFPVAELTIRRSRHSCENG